MPITCERNDARRCIVARASGLVQPHELLTFVRTERAGVYGAYALLFDATEAQTRARPSDIKILLDTVLSQLAATGRRGPVAIVASEHLKQLAALYEAACRGAGLHVIRAFRNRAEAEQWLDEQWPEQQHTEAT